MSVVKVIGGGLAGVEAAWALAKSGVCVELYEMKPKKFSPAHKMPTLAELVCSNSLKAKRLESSAGLLKVLTATVLFRLRAMIAAVTTIISTAR